MSSERFTERTLFHLHTTLTDGELTIGDYFQFAAEHHVERLIFLEHIRRQATYDCRAFAQQVQQYADSTGVPAMVGFEAKILADGELDIAPEALEVCQVVGIAEHGDRLTWPELQTSLRQIARRYPRDYPGHTFVWVHPGLYLHRQRQLASHQTEYQALLLEVSAAGLLIEQSARYQLVTEATRRLLPQIPIVAGVDAHRRADLQAWLNRRQG